MKNIQVKNQKRELWSMNMKKILDQAKKLIDNNKNVHPTGTLAITFFNAQGEENTYVWFVYVPQKKINHTQRHVSGK